MKKKTQDFPFQISSDGQNTEVLWKSKDNFLYGVDYDYYEKRIFFTERNQHYIYSAPFDETTTRLDVRFVCTHKYRTKITGKTVGTETPHSSKEHRCWMALQEALHCGDGLKANWCQQLWRNHATSCNQRQLEAAAGCCSGSIARVRLMTRFKRFSSISWTFVKVD